MAADKTKVAEATEISVEDKLRALYQLQLVDSEIDKIRTLRGELPLEVQDLEDEIEGLDTRILNLNKEIQEFETAISKKRNEITDSQSLIKNTRSSKIMSATIASTTPYRKR